MRGQFRPDDMRFNATMFMIDASTDGATPITDLLAAFGQLAYDEGRRSAARGDYGATATASLAEVQSDVDEGRE